MIKPIRFAETANDLLKEMDYYGAWKLLLFSVKFINYNDFSNFDAGETLHDW
jgi:hypothetical protein